MYKACVKLYVLIHSEIKINPKKYETIKKKSKLYFLGLRYNKLFDRTQ